MTTSATPAPLVREPDRKRQNLYLPLELTRWGIAHADEQFKSSLSRLVERLLLRYRESIRAKDRAARRVTRRAA